MSFPCRFCRGVGLQGGGRESPRQASYFSLLRQRNLTKRKATLLSATLRCATGTLRCSVQPGSRANSPAAQTSTSPDPSGLALLSAYRRRRGWGSKYSEAKNKCLARRGETRPGLEGHPGQTRNDLNKPNLKPGWRYKLSSYSRPYLKVKLPFLCARTQGFHSNSTRRMGHVNSRNRGMGRSNP